MRTLAPAKRLMHTPDVLTQVLQSILVDGAHGKVARCIVANEYTSRFKLLQYCAIMHDYYGIPNL